jgi:hypothetical protein
MKMIFFQMFVSGEHNPMKTFFNFRKPQGTNLIDRWGKKNRPSNK